MPPALELRAITKRFVAGAGGCTAAAHALRGVDLSVMDGESVAIVGDRGAGKSTLLFCAAGLLVPDTGILRWFGDDRRSAAAARATYHFAGAPSAGRRGAARRPEPRVQLIDGLESLTLDEIARLARWIARRRLCGDAVLVATRDAPLAQRLAGRVVVLRAGRVYPAVHPARMTRVAEPVTGVVRGSGTL